MGTCNQGAWPHLGGKVVRKVFLEGMIFAPRSKGYVSVNQVNSLKTLGGPGPGSDCVILEPMSELLGAVFLFGTSGGYINLFLHSLGI